MYATIYGVRGSGGWHHVQVGYTGNLQERMYGLNCCIATRQQKPFEFIACILLPGRKRAFQLYKALEREMKCSTEKLSLANIMHISLANIMDILKKVTEMKRWTRSGYHVALLRKKMTIYVQSAGINQTDGIGVLVQPLSMLQLDNKKLYPRIYQKIKN